MKNIADAIALFERNGWRSPTARRVQKVLSCILVTNSAFWYERDLSAPLREIKPKIEARVIFDGSAETIAWIQRRGEQWMKNRREFALGALEGHYYPSVRCGGEIVGYAKVAVGKVYVADYRAVVGLPEKYAFIYDSYILPEYRGNKLAQFLVGSVIGFLKGQGVEKLGCHIPPWNVVSDRTYTNAGFNKIGYVRFYRVCGLRIFSEKPPLARAIRVDQ